jgi:preprotein translocase SecE subunit
LGVQVPPSLQTLLNKTSSSFFNSFTSTQTTGATVAQEHAPNKPIHLVYLCGGLLGFVLLKWTGDWIWGYFARPDEFILILGSALAALIGGIYLYRKEESYTLVSEVTSELNKVTWPGPKEVKQATIVVVFMTILSALVLFFFDAVWSKLTQLVYGG